MRAPMILSLLIWGSVAVAEAPQSSQRPQARDKTPIAVAVAPDRLIAPFEDSLPAFRPVARPVSVAAFVPQLTAPTVKLRPLERPYLRPDLARGAATRARAKADRLVTAISPFAVAQSLRPIVRPAAITRRVVAQRLARVRGQVCGDPAIQGEAIGRVAGRGSCGIDNAVRVRSVAGVTLSPAATIDCRTASALKVWVAQGAKPAVGQTGGGISSLRVVSHYACRNRNSASSGRLSEHAFGRAIDIAGI